MIQSIGGGWYITVERAPLLFNIFFAAFIVIDVVWQELAYILALEIPLNGQS